MDYTVHGILQTRTLEWVAFLFSKGSSQPRDIVLQKPEPLVMEFNTHMRVRTHTNTHTPLAKEKLEEDPGEGGAVVYLPTDSHQ